MSKNYSLWLIKPSIIIRKLIKPSQILDKEKNAKAQEVRKSMPHGLTTVSKIREIREIRGKKKNGSKAIGR